MAQEHSLWVLNLALVRCVASTSWIWAVLGATIGSVETHHIDASLSSDGPERPQARSCGLQYSWAVLFSPLSPARIRRGPVSGLSILRRYAGLGAVAFANASRYLCPCRQDPINWVRIRPGADSCISCEEPSVEPTIVCPTVWSFHHASTHLICFFFVFGPHLPRTREVNAAVLGLSHAIGHLRDHTHGRCSTYST